jgi:hypothetical protein
MERLIDALQLRSADLMIPHNAGTASSLLFTTCTQQLVSILADADKVQLLQNVKKVFLLPSLSFSSPLVGDHNRFYNEKAIHAHSYSFGWLPFNSGVINFLGTRSAFKHMLLGPKAFKYVSLLYPVLNITIKLP